MEAEKVLEEVINDILQTGLIVTATKGHGKSNAVMHLARLFRQKENVHLKIFDTCLNWRFKFDSIPYIESENIIQAIPEVKDILIDVPYSDTMLTYLAITQIIMSEYEVKKEIKKALEGQNPYWNVYIIEEIQNIIGRNSFRGEGGRFWLKFVSEGRNFGMSYIGITQRLADVDTRIVERCKGYLIGQLIGDNDVKKIRRVCGEQIAELVKTLKVGEFIYYNGEKRKVYQIYFPKFVQQGKPEPYKEPKNGKIKVTKINILGR
ncbi:MAG: hypothetical protein DRN78_03955 [Thermoproteota archaeon]|nr:MAG: hypothetical protein DRN78_03955 [Candidatus Korarchaeota archaeon]